MKSSIARLIVQFFKEAGVRHIFGVSGHSVFDITDALYGDPEIRFVQAMHEGPAAYMAAAYAKAKRGIGVCMASSGAGATNLLTGIAYAYKESIPLIALSSDVRTREAGKGASSWHEIPQREMFAPVTKMSVTLKGRAPSIRCGKLCDRRRREERVRFISAFLATCRLSKLSFPSRRGCRSLLPRLRPMPPPSSARPGRSTKPPLRSSSPAEECTGRGRKRS
jgi:2-succinyl-5-enolpyruvyl-6-hydroxy-3-cyclohexene-1-carboxylate synthase